MEGLDSHFRFRVVPANDVVEAQVDVEVVTNRASRVGVLRDVCQRREHPVRCRPACNSVFVVLTNGIIVLTHTIIVLTHSIQVLTYTIKVLTGSIQALINSITVLTKSIVVLKSRASRKGVLRDVRKRREHPVCCRPVCNSVLVVLTNSIIVLTHTIVVLTNSIQVLTYSIQVLTNSIQTLINSVTVLTESIIVLTDRASWVGVLRDARQRREHSVRCHRVWGSGLGSSGFGFQVLGFTFGI